MTTDREGAFRFYNQLYGWEKVRDHDMDGMGSYRVYGKGGQQYGGMMTKPPQVPVAHWGFYLNVDAIDAGSDRITKNGGKIVNGPIEVPGGQWVVQAVDPQGAAGGDGADRPGQEP